MGIYDCLYDWQKPIVERIMPYRCFGLWVEMGVGKTPLSLALAERHLCTKIIVVTINSKATEDEFDKGSFAWWIKKSHFNFRVFDKNTKFGDLDAGKKYAVINRDTVDAYIVNYEYLFCRENSQKKELKSGLTKKKAQLRLELQAFIDSCHGCDVALIVDESHKMKTLNSLQTSALFELKSRLKLKANAVYTYLLTGTPFTRGYEDLYSQLRMLECRMTKTEFLDKFCIRGHYPSLPTYAQPVVGYKNVDELFQLVDQYALFAKSSDYVKLPERIFVKHEMKTTYEFNLYTREKAKAQIVNQELHRRKLPLIPYGKNNQVKIPNPFYANYDYPSEKWIADTPAKFYMRARQLSSGFLGNEEEYVWYNYDRLKLLEKILTENEDNYVLFYNYTPEFFEIYNVCEKLDYKIDIYNGLMKSMINYESYEKMDDLEKQIEKKRIILTNFASGSTGKNWQEYHNCIIFSLPVYKDWEQGLARIHRIGQDKSCFYHIFYQANWLDKAMMDALEERKEYDDKLFAQNLRQFQEEISNE